MNWTPDKEIEYNGASFAGTWQTRKSYSFLRSGIMALTQINTNSIYSFHMVLFYLNEQGEIYANVQDENTIAIWRLKSLKPKV